MGDAADDTLCGGRDFEWFQDPYGLDGGTVCYIKDYEIVRTTERAVLLKYGHRWCSPVWIPRSQIESYGGGSPLPCGGLEDAFIVTEWIALRKPEVPWEWYQWVG